MSTPHTMIVHGAAGRMGGRLIALAPAQGFEVVAAIVRAGSPRVGASIDARPDAPRYTTRAAPLPRADVLVDFSAPAAAGDIADAAVSLGIPLIVGTTGLDAAALAALRAASAGVAVMVTPNTSAGVAVLALELTRIARALGPEYRASIVESHHVHKKDAPSGTARRLAEAVRAGGGQLDDDQVHAIRAGDTIGEHTVRFAGPGEELVITHRASTRDLFALGALKAARWLIGRRAGWYTMDDLLASKGA